MTTSVVIADDHEIVRRGVTASLARLGFDVVGEAADGLQAVSKCKVLQPRLLVLDLSMPRAGAIEVVEEVRRWSPETRIVVLTGVTDATFLQPVINAGIGGIVLKDSPAETLERALAAREFFLDPKLEELLAKAREALLSKREQQVLGLLLRGNSNAEVAGLINISPHTVNNHRSSIMRKLGAHSIVELMSISLRMGLIDPGVLKEKPPT